MRFSCFHIAVLAIPAMVFASDRFADASFRIINTDRVHVMKAIDHRPDFGHVFKEERPQEDVHVRVTKPPLSSRKGDDSLRAPNIKQLLSSSDPESIVKSIQELNPRTQGSAVTELYRSKAPTPIIEKVLAEVDFHQDAWEIIAAIPEVSCQPTAFIRTLNKINSAEGQERAVGRALHKLSMMPGSGKYVDSIFKALEHEKFLSTKLKVIAMPLIFTHYNEWTKLLYDSPEIEPLVYAKKIVSEFQRAGKTGSLYKRLLKRADTSDLNALNTQYQSECSRLGLSSDISRAMVRAGSKGPRSSTPQRIVNRVGDVLVNEENILPEAVGDIIEGYALEGAEQQEESH